MDPSESRSGALHGDSFAVGHSARQRVPDRESEKRTPVVALPPRPRRPSGSVLRLQKARGPSWWAKYRLPDGTQVKRKVGPAWEGGGRPAAGYFTKRLAEDWLRDTLDDVYRAWSGERAGTRTNAAGQAVTTSAPVVTGVTFADAAAEYLRFVRARPGLQTVDDSQLWQRDRRSPAPGVRRARARGHHHAGDRALARGHVERSTGARALQQDQNNLLALMHAIFRRAVKLYGLAANPVANVDRFRVRTSNDIQVFSTEEVWALVRAAASDRRRDLPDRRVHRASPWGTARAPLARHRPPGSTIRVRASYAAGHLSTPKSGKVRAVPMAPDVARALAKLGQQKRLVGEDDFVFCGRHGLPLGGDALSSRYRNALERGNLRKLRFHDRGHTFGTRMIAKANIRRVQEWMGHADIQTTMKYLHYAPRDEDAALVAEALGSSSAKPAARDRADPA